MKYKMIVSDMDDTLLRNDFTISSETKKDSKFIIASNNKDGVKKIIEKFIFN